MRHTAFLHLIWAALAALFISGCATDRLPEAKDAAERVTRAAIYAQKQADAAERVGLQLLAERAISSLEAAKIHEAADEVRTSALAAHMALALGKSPDSALTTLQAARSSLAILESFLANRSAK